MVGLDGVGATERSRKTRCVQFGSDPPGGSGILRVFRGNSLAPAGHEPFCPARQGRIAQETGVTGDEKDWAVRRILAAHEGIFDSSETYRRIPGNLLVSGSPRVHTR